MPTKLGRKYVSSIVIDLAIWEALRALCNRCEFTWEELLTSLGRIIEVYDLAMSSLPNNAALNRAIDLFEKQLDRKDLLLADALTGKTTLESQIKKEKELIANELQEETNEKRQKENSKQENAKG
ncbi:hypothetical protein ES703_123144 [subsurface metagenome]